MDLIMKDGAKLAPKDTPEAVAIFRAQVIGPLLTRVFTSHGELAEAIRALARERHLPPGAAATRFYSETTLERWYYRFKRRSLEVSEDRVCDRCDVCRPSTSSSSPAARAAWVALRTVPVAPRRALGRTS